MNAVTESCFWLMPSDARDANSRKAALYFSYFRYSNERIDMLTSDYATLVDRYSELIYYIVFTPKDGFMIPHQFQRTVCFYFHHCCKLLECRLLRAKAIGSSINLLIKLNPRLSINDFVKIAAKYTTTWIRQQSISENFSGWEDGVHTRSLSPENKFQFIEELKAFPEDKPDFNTKLLDLSEVKDNLKQLTNLHHIIFWTIDAKLILKVKFSKILIDRFKETATAAASKIIACTMSRDHVHMIVNLPGDLSVDRFVTSIKVESLKWMLGNIHFHKVDGWSDFYCAHTISPNNFHQEEHDVYTQDEIHKLNPLDNELIRIAYRQQRPIPSLRWPPSKYFLSKNILPLPE